MHKVEETKESNMPRHSRGWLLLFIGVQLLLRFKYFSCSFAVACYSYKTTVSLEARCEMLELVHRDGSWQLGIQKWDRLKLFLYSPLQKPQLPLPGTAELWWTVQLRRRYCRLPTTGGGTIHQARFQRYADPSSHYIPLECTAVPCHNHPETLLFLS